MASIVTYTGFDSLSGIYATSYPNADAAAASYVSALSGALDITFDNLSTTADTTINPIDGVTITFTNQENYTVRNDLSINAGTLQEGFDTSLRNSNGSFIGLDAADVNSPVYAVFTFDNPISAFGAYFTGAGSDQGGVTLQFNDGSTQVLTVANATSNSGGVEFFGFTDYGTSFTSVTAQVGITGGHSFDIIGVDDVIVPVAAAPEPGTLGMLLLGAAGLAALRARSAFVVK